MKEQESWYTHEKRKLLCKERYFTTSHHYFFELKEAKNGSKYIIIHQRKKVGTEFVGSKVRLFEDEMLEFNRILQRLISMATQKNEQVVSNMIPNYQHHHCLPSPTESYDCFPAPTTLFQKAKYHVRQLWSREPAPSYASPDLRPVFFQHVLTTTNWRQFEEHTYYILKLLGIQTIYHFLGERQAGRADGFFKVGNMAVLYDCTLRAEHIDHDKQDQMTNYCHQLHQGYIELSEDTREEFTHYHKQVWIISRGTTRRIKLMNSIEVKEINIIDLMNLYDKRLTQKIPDHMLEMSLRHLQPS